MYREDILRHLRAFQSPRCGIKYGKSYALKRHMEKSKRCVESAKGLPINHKWNSPGLNEAIRDLQAAKKEDIYEVAERCLRYNYGKYS